MQIYTMTGILKLIGSLGYLKEVKTTLTMDMILGKCKFPDNFVPYFQKHIVGTHGSILLNC